MELPAAADGYFVWGIDDSPYGPVSLPVLVDWIKDERVRADTWIFKHDAGVWQSATEIPELKEFFQPSVGNSFDTTTSHRYQPEELRRIKILAGLKAAQLAHLAWFFEGQKVSQHAEVIRQGGPGDAMFLLMSGEVRARILSGGRELVLATFGAGDIFGEMSLFDRGPRSADVIANMDSFLLKLSIGSFERLTREMPELATPFLEATLSTLAARIRTDNQRLARATQQFSAGR